GPKPVRAQWVAGKVSEKAATPSPASAVPPARPVTAIEGAAVALFCAVMNHGSSSGNLADILRGELDRYSPGEKLPSSRDLVDRFGVSPVTAPRAPAALAAEGLVVTRPGAGAYRAQRRGTGPRAVDTSWQQVALTAEEQHGEPAPRVVDAS